MAGGSGKVNNDPDYDQEEEDSDEENSDEDYSDEEDEDFVKTTKKTKQRQTGSKKERSAASADRKREAPLPKKTTRSRSGRSAASAVQKRENSDMSSTNKTTRSSSRQVNTRRRRAASSSDEVDESSDVSSTNKTTRSRSGRSAASAVQKGESSDASSTNKTTRSSSRQVNTRRRRAASSSDGIDESSDVSSTNKTTRSSSRQAKIKKQKTATKKGTSQRSMSSSSSSANVPEQSLFHSDRIYAVEGQAFSIKTPNASNETVQGLKNLAEKCFGRTKDFDQQTNCFVKMYNDKTQCKTNQKNLKALLEKCVNSDPNELLIAYNHAVNFREIQSLNSGEELIDTIIDSSQGLLQTHFSSPTTTYVVIDNIISKAIANVLKMKVNATTIYDDMIALKFASMEGNNLVTFAIDKLRKKVKALDTGRLYYVPLVLNQSDTHWFAYNMIFKDGVLIYCNYVDSMIRTDPDTDRQKSMLTAASLVYKVMFGDDAKCTIAKQTDENKLFLYRNEAEVRSNFHKDFAEWYDFDKYQQNNNCGPAVIYTLFDTIELLPNYKSNGEEGQDTPKLHFGNTPNMFRMYLQMMIIQNALSIAK